MRSGIYQILNVINGKRYIGQSDKIRKRWNSHKSSLKAGRHTNNHLQNAYNRYGAESFRYSMVEDVNSPMDYDPEDQDMVFDFKETLREREQYHMDSYDWADLYNIAPTAGGSCLGIKHTKEFKENLSKMRMGKNNPMYGKSGEDSPTYGKLFSEEHRRKLSEANIGKKLSEETKRKMSEARSGKKNHMYGKRGKDSPNYGKKRTEEVRRQISERQMGEKNHNYGKHLSEETKRKMSIGLSGENSPHSNMVTYKGKTQNISAWAKETGIHPSTVSRRLQCGWDVDEALTTKTKKMLEREEIWFVFH